MTEEQRKYIREWNGKKSFTEIAKELDVPRSSVVRHAKKFAKEEAEWTDYEIDLLRRFVEFGVPKVRIAKSLGRSKFSVIEKAREVCGK